MARMFEKREQSADYAESAQKRIELSRNYHVQYLMVKLTVNHTNGASPSLKDNLLFNAIQDFSIVANGDLTIKSVPASKLYVNSLLGTSKLGVGKSDLTSNKSNAISYAYAIIPFSMFGTVRPHDTILNTELFKSLDLLVNWGSSNTIGKNITINNAKLEVFSSALIGYARNQAETIKYHLETNLRDEITATTTEHQIQMPVNKIYKSITIMALNDGQRSDDIIKGIKIKSGDSTVIDLPAEAIRSKNIFEFKPDQDDNLKGIYVINFAGRGRLSDCLNTITDFKTLEIELDVVKQGSKKNEVNILSDVIRDTLTVVS